MNQPFVSYTIRLSNEMSAQAQLCATKEGKTVEDFIVKWLKIILSNSISDQQLRTILESDELPQIINVVPLNDFSLEIKFKTGIQGIFDLKPTIEQGGVFAVLTKMAEFKKVSIGKKGRYIFWPDEIEIDADSIYQNFFMEAPNDEYPES